MSRPCKNQASCKAKQHGYSCKCKAGYSIESDCAAVSDVKATPAPPPPEDSGGVSTMIVVVVVVVGLLLIVGAKVILGRRQKVGLSGGCDIDLIKLLSNINTKPLRTRVAPELFCVSMFHRLYEETDCAANPLPM